MNGIALKGRRGLNAIFEHRDLLIAFGVIGMVIVMIIPLPTFLLDVFLALNISVALVILLVSMYAGKALDFSVFPGLLLVITLFRLSLNVASTRLILAEADAGAVIDAFGTFVTKGNIIVGFIIFIVLIVIQFVVITKGATRIAEVAARFTLDAMPGKQMAIDADLNAGIITELEAKDRRDEIRREADFYGAMDGASKFVRGDAIAGIIITIINIIGGFIIGMARLQMSFGEAASTYTQLTIGDGLVTQMPALIISTAVGIIVSRAASKANLGHEISRQLTQSPKAIFISSGVMALFAVVPGMPSLAFALLSVIAFSAGIAIQKGVFTAPEEEAESEADQAVPEEEEKPEDFLHVDQLELEIGYGLIPLVDKSQGGDLLERISMIRKQLAMDLGLILPPVRIRDNIQLKPNEYIIKIKGVEMSGGELMSGSYLAMDPGNVTRKIKGIPTTEPAFGLPAIWITESQKEAAELSGYTVVELSAVAATHLTEVVKKNAHEILTREDVQRLIDNVKETNKTVIEEINKAEVPVAEIQKILQNLLSEQVSIRDLVTILEIISDNASHTKNTDVLTEYVRSGLARRICDELKDDDNVISVITLDPHLEQQMETSLQQTERGYQMVLEPSAVRKIQESVTENLEEMAAANEKPVLICSPLIRAQVRRMLAPSFPELTVVSYNEITRGINIKSRGMVSLNEN